MTAARVVVFGDVIDDLLARPLAPVLPDTDTTASIRSIPGGSAANLTEHDSPTGAIVIVVEGDTRTMFTQRGANSMLHPDRVGEALLKDAALLHLTGYSVIDSPDLEALRRLIARARAHGMTVSVDPGSAGFIAEFGADRFLAAIEGATLLFPSVDEARVLTGVSDPAGTLRVLGARFPVVALTRGREGVLVAADGVIHEIAAVAASALDPTGAGDAFCAGFLNAWLASGDARAAADAGVHVAARAVAVSGGRPPA